MRRRSVSRFVTIPNFMMHNELTNLLPSERKRTLRRSYFLRLGVIGIVLVNILVLAAALLLLPTFVLLTQSAAAKANRLATIESALSSADEQTLSVRLAALTKDAATLTALADVPSVSAVIRTVLAVPRPGIALSGLIYTPATDKNSSRMLVVSGTAATRDALRNYQIALQNAPVVISALLPVSAYAKESGITFTITITLKP